MHYPAGETRGNSDGQVNMWPLLLSLLSSTSHFRIQFLIPHAPLRCTQGSLGLQLTRRLHSQASLGDSQLLCDDPKCLTPSAMMSRGGPIKHRSKDSPERDCQFLVGTR